MGISLSRQQRQQLIDWAKQAGEQECCGLLLGKTGLVEKIELAANVAIEPTQNFEIDPAALVGAEKRARQGGLQIVGYFHSHPNGLAQPSTTDAMMAAPDNRFWLIIAKDSVSAWQAIRDGKIRKCFNPATLLITEDAQG